MDLPNVCSVVRVLAHRTDCVSRGVFVSDCGDLQVLQSSDLPLSTHRRFGLQRWISEWVGRHELEVLFRLPVFWFQGHVHISGLLNSSSPQRCHHCDGVGVQDLFHDDWTEDTSTEEESSHSKEREKWLTASSLDLECLIGQILSCDSGRCSLGVELIIDILLFFVLTAGMVVLTVLHSEDQKTCHSVNIILIWICLCCMYLYRSKKCMTADWNYFIELHHRKHTQHSFLYFLCSYNDIMRRSAGFLLSP